MQKTKAKRDSFWRRQMLPFVVVWTISIAIVGVISRMWPWQIFSLTPEEKVNLTLLSNVIVSGLIQAQLVERLLKHPMRRWMLYTTTSALIILLLDRLLAADFVRLDLYQSLYPIVGFYTYTLVSSLALNVPTALLQALWLHQHVKRAWLWPLLTIPLLMLFTAIPYGGEYYQILKGVTLLSLSVSQAGLMHYLWRHPRETEKAKIDHSVDIRADENARIERLQDADHSTPLWDSDDEQALQRDSL